MLGGLGNKLSGVFSGGNAAIGLNIGSSSIKLVELKKQKESWKLLHFGIVQLPEDAIVNREIMNQLVVTDHIKTLTSQLKLSSKSVCISLSGTGVIVKRMTLEVPKIKDLQSQVFWEAEQYLPFDPTEVFMDFQMLSRGKDNKTDVMFVAVKKSILEGYINCVQDAGLKPVIVDLDFFSLQNLFETNYPSNQSEAVGIIDVGANSLKIMVLHRNIPVFTKDVAMGGHNLTVEIQKSMNVSYADAESLKIEGHGGTIPQEVSELSHIMAENLAVEIKRAFDFYGASSAGAPVSYILLAGGSARIQGLSKVIEDTVGMPTQLINSFNAISYDPAVFSQDYLATIGPIAAVPIGLALRAGAVK